MSLDRQVFTTWRVRAGYLVALAVLLLARPTPLSLLLASAVGLVGLIFRGYAAGFLHKQEQLTTSGPYDHTRNPLYFGSALLALAAAIAARSIAAGVLLVGYFALFYSVVMRREEQELRLRHGPAFDRYAREVPLFFPRLRPPNRGSAPGGGFSWHQFKRNHEWQASVGFLFLLAILFAIWRWRSMH
jgi:protein-S-isoprenylcysteine O-methyltransferase Ste14